MHFPAVEDIEHALDPVDLPSLARVSYTPRAPEVDDVPARTEDALDALGIDLDAGATVALGVGSRGIADIEPITRTVVTRLQEDGYEPIIVPAMGSHGGGTPAGQRDVLAELGILPTRVGCRIDDRIDTNRIGRASIAGSVLEVPFATAATEADAVIPINRVAPHTSFDGSIESGLCKMLSVGFGKRAGARQVHRYGLTHGFEPYLEAVLPVILSEVYVPGGIAIVENAAERTADVVGVPGESLPDAERELLARARELSPTLPFDAIDLLIVDAIGKDVSGTGMDPNVIGRRLDGSAPPPHAPTVDRIYVRSLTERTRGNANGVGFADAVHRDVATAIDVEATYVNVLTSGYPRKAALPMVMPTDEQAIRALIGSLGAIESDRLRLAWIPNTSELSTMRISPALFEATDDPAIAVAGWEDVHFTEGALATRSISG